MPVTMDTFMIADSFNKCSCPIYIATYELGTSGKFADNKQVFVEQIAFIFSFMCSKNISLY